MSLLKANLKKIIPEKQDLIKLLIKEKGYLPVNKEPITIKTIFNGLKGQKQIFWQASKVDPQNGISFQNLTIRDCQLKLIGPKNFADSTSKDVNQDKDRIFYIESMFWLLLTGKTPQRSDIINLIKDINYDAPDVLPEYLSKLIDSLPRNMHPMTKISICVASINFESKFAKKFAQGENNKLDYWEDQYDDIIYILQLLPLILNKIVNNTNKLNIDWSQFISKKEIDSIQNSNDLKKLGNKKPVIDYCLRIASAVTNINKENDSPKTANSSEIASSQANDTNDIIDLIRLYLCLHVDHEGGNVSAHATHLVGSTLSDPALSYSAGLLGLAGPLHGLAAQNSIKFILNLKQRLNINSIDDINKGQKYIERYIWTILGNNQVVPGFGHGVLRNVDPRFTALRTFIELRPKLLEDVNIQLMLKLSDWVTPILIEHGHCKNPYPNVDWATGCLFNYLGLEDINLITVIFGCSRIFGAMTQLVWDRILILPIERPSSIDWNYVDKLIANGNDDTNLANKKIKLN